MKKQHYFIFIFCLLIITMAQAQNRPGKIKLSDLFNELDLIIPNDSYENTLVNEGDRFVSEVMHLPKRIQNNTLNKILIIADSSLYSSCENIITRYAYDIYYVYGCEINMTIIKGENYEDIKNLILNDSTNLDGVVFMGDIASAWYEANDVIINDYSCWPCDMYYMDLDVIWNNNDNDDYFDNYSGDFNPEIFVGRICTNKVGNGSNELDLFERYMDKNHAFWIGHRQINKMHSLSYTNPTWNLSQNDIINGIHYLYGQNVCDTVTSNTIGFCANDYLDRLRNERYEFIQLACHSTYYNHYFDSLVPTNIPNVYDTLSVIINKSKIYNNGTNAIGMNLFCCSACRWHVQGFLGGCYVYSPQSSLLSLIGSSKPGSLLDMPDFYKSLNHEKTMGQAFVD